MKNCYFCHRPTGYSGIVQITWTVRNIKGSEPTEVLERAHRECLENAHRWFIEPEPFGLLAEVQRSAKEFL